MKKKHSVIVASSRLGMCLILDARTRAYNYTTNHLHSFITTSQQTKKMIKTEQRFTEEDDSFSLEYDLIFKQPQTSQHRINKHQKNNNI